MDAKIPQSARQKRKEQVTDLLDRRDWEELGKWSARARSPLYALSTALFSTDPLRCRRAIEAIGIAAAVVAETNLEAVRNLVRHNFWMMNDESGNIGWYAPETIGELLYNVPVLIDEYAVRLPAFFVEEPFERGAYRAVARIAAIRTDAFAEFTDLLARSTASNDPVIRYHALLALASIDPPRARKCAARMATDTTAISEYDPRTGDFVEIRIDTLVSAVLSA